MTNVRDADPETAKAVLRAVTQPTHLQRCETMLRVFMAASEGVMTAYGSKSDVQMETALFILGGAAEESERLIGSSPEPEPPQAA